jgi:hypothetical protein
MISRFILSLCLLTLGVIVYIMHLDLVKINDSISKVGEQVNHLKIEQLQKAAIKIDKPRVPPIKYLYKKTVTIIDTIYQR